MTSTPRCPECHQTGGHKMSCDTGYRQRVRARAAADGYGYGYGFETTAASVDPSPQESCLPAPASAPIETPGTCGGGE